MCGFPGGPRSVTGVGEEGRSGHFISGSPLYKDFYILLIIATILCNTCPHTCPSSPTSQRQEVPPLLWPQISLSVPCRVSLWGGIKDSLQGQPWGEASRREPAFFTAATG